MRHHHRDAGLTLAELLITAAIIGMVSAIAFRLDAANWRRSQANAVVKELSTWLEEVSIGPEKIGEPCVVTISTGTGLKAGDRLASVTPNSCARNPELHLPGISGQQNFNIGVIGAGNSSTIQWSFTPRGFLVLANPDPNGITNIQINVNVDNQLPLRCVRLSDAVGLIRVGSNNTSGVLNTGCNEWSRI